MLSETVEQAITDATRAAEREDHDRAVYEATKASRIEYLLCMNEFHRLTDADETAIRAQREANGACDFCRRASALLIANEDIDIDSTWL